MRLIYAMLLGFILDLIFGDPHGLIHPVQIIGWFIDKLKKGMQHMIYGCSYEEVREKEIERKAGVEKTAGFFLMLFIVAGTGRRQKAKMTKLSFQVNRIMQAK